MQLLINITSQRRQVIVNISVRPRRRPPQPPCPRHPPPKVWGARPPCTTSPPSASLGSHCPRSVVHILCGLVIAATLATAFNSNTVVENNHNHHHHDNNNNKRGSQLDVTVLRTNRPTPRGHDDGGQGYQAQEEGVGVGVDAHLKHFRSKIRTNIGRNELVGINRRDASDDDEVLIEGEVTTITPTSSESTTASTTRSTTTLKTLLHAGATPSYVVNQQDSMSPVQETALDTMGSNVVVFVLVLAIVLATLGVLTCILSTYRHRGGGGGHRGGPRGASSYSATADMPSDTPGLLSGSNANLPMLALPGGMCAERRNHDRAALHDKHVRLKSVRLDTELDLPPNIRLPDGEELPYGCSTRLHIRDPLQESEIYQKCVRPPPNRTIYDGESPPPYRSSSAGLLSHGTTSTSGSSDWSSLTSDGVIRCHSMSSHAATPPAPAVVVPSRSRRLSAFTDAAPAHHHRTGGGVLAHLTMVPCLAERQQRRPTPPPSQSV